MAFIRKRGISWVADIRRTGHKSISKSFPTRTLAQEWSRKIEHEMDMLDFKDARGLSTITLSSLIDRYTEEFHPLKQFGKNKQSVLALLKTNLGKYPLDVFGEKQLSEHVAKRMRDGAGGVTVAIDLTYLGGVFRAAKHVWKLPVDATFIRTVRSNLHYQGVSTRTKERDRRPTPDELIQICKFFDDKGIRQKVPMSDIINFGAIFESGVRAVI